MNTESFKTLIESLTGTEIKAALDAKILDPILAYEDTVLDCSQLNELLLLAHKDRVELPFFKHFFQRTGSCTIGDLPAFVEDFQKSAMLLYGNFIFAYRTLSRITKQERFDKLIKSVNKQPAAEEARYKARTPKLVDITLIDKEDTPFVGYLTSAQLTADEKRCGLLLDARETGKASTWDAYITDVEAMAASDERAFALHIINAYRTQVPKGTLDEFVRFLIDSQKKMKAIGARSASIRKVADKNQTVYLSWDHMDVYFATSMRKDWEYKDLYEFIEDLMSKNGLPGLNIRYFDPTQSFTTDRIHKGLVESLMLKRAVCTVYSVQDSDTLGKDSELASTLAQGKPVIAFIPEIDVDERGKELIAGDLGMINGRLNVVLSSEEARERFNKETQVRESAKKLQDFILAEIWRTLPETQRATEFRSTSSGDIDILCGFIAREEKRLYDKRAKTLSKDHPLAIQVNLDTGVANGLLVVRKIDDCAELLRRILISDLEFEVEQNKDMWLLTERISKCHYRVVTKDVHLGNCFWNFYLRGKNEKGVNNHV